MTTKEASGLSKDKRTRPIPYHTLEEALRVAKAIMDGNNGKPWKPPFVAEYLRISPTSSGFRDLTSSAMKYGLTTGTWNASQIGLTDLGRSLAKPTDPSRETEQRRQAVEYVEAFKNVFDHFRDGKLPSAENGYFRNVLETEFSIPKEHMESFLRQLVENGKFAGIISEIQGQLWVTYSTSSSGGMQTEAEGPTESTYAAIAADTGFMGKESPGPTSDAKSRLRERNQIFIVHGKNHAPLLQLQAILDKFKVPYKAAIDEPHKGRPISRKVAELMHECTSAIVIFTADESYVDSGGNEIWRPSDNAVYELGAASVLYDNKIVILKETNVVLASDFSDLGYISFEKDELDAEAMKLITELIGFGFLQLTPV